MLTVLCVYRGGGDFNPEYVERLRDGVRRNLSLPHRFFCIALPLDSDGRDRVIALHREWRGWWAKLEVFRIPGPAIYIDLDTVIVGSLDPLAQWALNPKNLGRLGMIQDFYSGYAQSGVMAWHSNMEFIYRDFIEETRRPDAWIDRPGRRCPGLRIDDRTTFWGDADWIRSHVQGIAMLPTEVGGIASYKTHLRDFYNVGENGKVPEGISVVCFHGHPRPHEVDPTPEWMREHWIGSTSNRLEVIG